MLHTRASIVAHPRPFEPAAATPRRIAETVVSEYLTAEHVGRIIAVQGLPGSGVTAQLQAIEAATRHQ